MLHGFKYMLANWWPILVIGFFLLVAPQLTNQDPLHANSGHELESPSQQYWFGTDHLGRDEWSRLLAGGQRTVGGALLATAITISGGLLLACATIYSWRITRFIAEIFRDALLAFPILVIALVVRTLFSGNLLTLALAIGLAGIAPYAQVAADALKVARQAPHIEGAHSIGASKTRIFLYHLIPTALPTLTSFGSVILGWMILYQAALSFIGLGGDPSLPDWGSMLNQGRGYIQQAPHLIFLPGGAIALVIWSANRLADKLSGSPISRTIR